MLDAPATCVACSQQLIEYNVDGPEVAPLTGNWQQECLACLATDNDTDATVNMQHLVAEFLAHILLQQHGMPLTQPVKYDASKLPRSSKTQPGVSGECTSCLKHWLLDHSMGVVKDRGKMAH
jgi:hypothetical protein